MCIDLLVLLRPVIGDRLCLRLGRRGNGQLDQGNPLFDDLAFDKIFPIGIAVIIGLDGYFVLEFISLLLQKCIDIFLDGRGDIIAEVIDDLGAFLCDMEEGSVMG